MATVWKALAEMMVLVGDLLVLVAAGAGLLALIGEQREWGWRTLRQIWSNGLFGSFLVAVGLLAKVTTEEVAGEPNGYLFGFDNGFVGGLLLLALVLMAGAYLLRRRRGESTFAGNLGHEKKQDS